MPNISHITLGTNNVERAAGFYDAVMPLLGFARLHKPADFPLTYEHPEGPTLFVDQPLTNARQPWAMAPISPLQLPAATMFTKSMKPRSNTVEPAKVRPVHVPTMAKITTRPICATRMETNYRQSASRRTKLKINRALYATLNGRLSDF